MTRSAGWLVAGLGLLMLGGCRAGYEVDLRNLTDQPVVARIETPHPDGAPQVRATRFVGPGERSTLFYQADAGTRVSLVVDFAGNVSYPATLALSRGRTAVNVRRADTGARGRLQLEELTQP